MLIYFYCNTVVIFNVVFQCFYYLEQSGTDLLGLYIKKKPYYQVEIRTEGTRSYLKGRETMTK